MSKKNNKKFDKNGNIIKDNVKQEVPIEDNNETAETETTANETESEAAEEEQQPQKADETVELLEELAEMKDKYLRQVAEFDNYRKRTLKEKAELILNGGEKVLTSLLPILDDFERAKENMEKTEDLAALREGVNLVYQKLLKVLESQGLKKIETEGKDFDTDFHEAIAMIPAPTDEQKGKVIDCVQTGYQLNEKVIRHAKVAVGQ